jgi:hypothetical protein
MNERPQMGEAGYLFEPREENPYKTRGLVLIGVALLLTFGLFYKAVKK